MSMLLTTPDNDTDGDIESNTALNLLFDVNNYLSFIHLKGTIKVLHATNYYMLGH